MNRKTKSIRTSGAACGFAWLVACLSAAGCSVVVDSKLSDKPEQAQTKTRCNADSSKCRDDDVCNGVESCGADNFCLDGADAPDGTTCYVNNDFNEGGVCVGGRCRTLGCGNGFKEAGETCDDGDDDNTDGCRTDCKLTCTKDVDCDNNNPCDGVERCDVMVNRCARARLLPAAGTACMLPSGAAGMCNADLLCS